MHDWIGHSIGKYHIIEKLGEGGMATVYRAYDTNLERNVAVKIIRTDEFGPAVLQRVLQRFEREARSLAKLIHPNIIGVIDFGKEDQTPYLVMPLISGGTLKQITGKAIPYQQAANMLVPIAQALSYAHSQGVIHRDIKPSNILLTDAGNPLLTDFGIAKLLDNGDGKTLTGTGVGIGTPEYMAPEQGLGKTVDERADIYALGVVYYELITGRKPFTADTPVAVVVKQISDPLPRPKLYVATIPEEVEQVIFKALAKNPADRYANMQEFATALDRLDRQATRITVPAKNVPLERSKHSTAKVDNKKHQEEVTRDEVDGVQPSANEPSVQPIKPQPSNRGTINLQIPRKWFWYAAGIGCLLLLIGSGLIARNLLMSKNVASHQATLSVPNTVAPVFTQTPSPIPTTIPTLVIGSKTVSEKDSMILVFVPAGEFMMGYSDETANTTNDAKPQHKVYLNAYWIDLTEVTNAQYEQCVASGYCSQPGKNGSFTRHDYYTNSEFHEYPVVNVSWQDAINYCEWAGRRVPTEAEWEKAARGTGERIYPWGNQQPDCGLANYGSCKDGDTNMVGSHPAGASPYGAQDMAGNVFEWVNDWYASDYYSTSPDNNPTGPVNGTTKVTRGGSWNGSGILLQGTQRFVTLPDHRSGLLGFRCVMPVEESYHDTE